MELQAALAALLMVVVANAAPWLAGQLMRGRLAYPLDCTACWPNGVRVLGSHKTWRGLIAAMLGCSVAGYLLEFGALVGAGVGGLAMAGDAFSSAVKRLLRLAPGSEVPGIDQVPESLLPLLLFAPMMRLGLLEVAIVVAAFTVLDVLTERLRHRA